jgi:hypothetical protein
MKHAGMRVKLKKAVKIEVMKCTLLAKRPWMGSLNLILMRWVPNLP